MFTDKQKETFWSHVDKSGDCWIWLAALYHDGYGKVKCGGKMYSAHRLSYIIENGETDLQVLHTCDNPKCVNPKHLFTGTHKENMQDMAEKGRGAGRFYPTKLNQKKANEIRAMGLAKIPVKQIARFYGINPSTTRDVLNWRTWK
jgi:hypothetical protein